MEVRAHHKVGVPVWSEEDLAYRREVAQRRGSADRSPQPAARDRSEMPWTTLTLSCWPVPPGIWMWLRRALRDIGYPVSGWSFGRDADRTLEVQMKGDRDVLIAAIQGLWDNERPGVPLTIVRR